MFCLDLGAKHQHYHRVTAVEMSPIDDTLMTASLDETVRMWDLRSSTCQVKIGYGFNIFYLI
jgi:WD40 repeat protein